MEDKMHNPNINLIKMNKPVMKSIIRGDKPEIKSNLLNESKEEISYEEFGNHWDKKFGEGEFERFEKKWNKVFGYINKRNKEERDNY